ncbi:MAG: hypothetical protein ACXWD8_10790 [Mycobacterium sp.]
MRDRDAIDALETGRSYRFSDWPNESVPKIAAGVYTIWDSGRFIYVGMAGRGLAAENIDAPDEPVKAKGAPDPAELARIGEEAAISSASMSATASWCRISRFRNRRR